MIVDPIHDHTYLAWGTFWRRDPTEMVMAEDSPLPVLEPLILIFDSHSWLKIFMIPMISLQKKKKKKKKKKDFTISKFKPSQILNRLTVPFLLWDFLCQNKFYRLPLSSIVFLRNTFLDCYCDIPIWLIVWYVWVCNKSRIGYLLCRSGFY